MTSICFVVRETSYGPFFSSKVKAEEYLREGKYAENEEDLQKMLGGHHYYINVYEVELDNPDVRNIFDG